MRMWCGVRSANVVRVARCECSKSCGVWMWKYLVSDCVYMIEGDNDTKTNIIHYRYTTIITKSCLENFIL